MCDSRKGPLLKSHLFIHLWEIYVIPTATCKLTSLTGFGISRSRHGISQSTCRKTYILGFALQGEKKDALNSPPHFCGASWSWGQGCLKKPNEFFPPKLPPESTHCCLLLGTRRCTQRAVFGLEPALSLPDAKLQRKSAWRSPTQNLVYFWGFLYYPAWTIERKKHLEHCLLPMGCCNNCLGYFFTTGLTVFWNTLWLEGRGVKDGE